MIVRISEHYRTTLTYLIINYLLAITTAAIFSYCLGLRYCSCYSLRKIERKLISLVKTRGSIG